MRLRLIQLVLLSLMMVKALPVCSLDYNPRFQKVFPDNDQLQDKTGIISAIVEDKDGFIWFGGNQGLVRFDAVNLKTFRHSSKDPFSISSNLVTAMTLDKQGVLWVGTDNGLNRYNANTESFTKYFADQDSVPGTQLIDSAITTLAPGASNQLLIGTTNGLSVLDTASGEFRNYYMTKSAAGLLAPYVNKLLFDSEGNINIGYRYGGFSVLSGKSREFTHWVYHEKNNQGLCGNKIMGLAEHWDGKIWLATQGEGVCLFDPKMREFTWYRHQPDNANSLSSDTVWDVHVDDKHVWFATDHGGVSVFQPDKRLFTNLRADKNKAGRLSSDTVRVIYKDSNQDFWLATYPTEINFIDRSMSAVATLYHEENNLNSLSNNAITSVKIIDGQTWVGTENGLNILSRDGAGQLKIKRVFNDYTVLAILELDQDIWIGTWASGLLRVTKNAELVSTEIPFSGSNSINDKFIWSLFTDKNGVLWVGTENGGLNRFDPKTGKYKHYVKKSGKANTIADNYVRAIVQDDIGNLWLGTLGGLDIFNPVTETFIHLELPVEEEGFSNQRVLSLFNYAGAIWVGTQMNGLFKVDVKTRAATLISTWDGLPSNHITGITADAQNYLWVTTAKGIARLNIKNNRVNVLTKKNGLAGDNYNRTAIAYSEDGVLYLGSDNGLSMIAPKNMTFSRNKAPIRVTELRLLNQVVKPGESSLLTTAMPYADNLVFSYDDKMISFAYALLDYRRAGKSHYAYKLEGFDDGWIDVGQSTLATYTSLPAGYYAFKARAHVGAGEFVETRPIQFRVLPPLWLSPAAYLFYALIITFIYYAISRHLRALKNSEVDLLTGCLNRLGLQKHLNSVFSGGTTKTEYVVIVFDIDYFKQVNDSKGHQVGDQVIIGVASIVGGELRNIDKLARWGGEEFVALCRVRTIESARQMAERVRASVELHTFMDEQDQPFSVSVSVGFAMVDNEDSFDAVFKKADDALYRAKSEGRNKVCGHVGGLRAVN